MLWNGASLIECKSKHFLPQLDFVCMKIIDILLYIFSILSISRWDLLLVEKKGGE